MARQRLRALARITLERAEADSEGHVDAGNEGKPAGPPPRSGAMGGTVTPRAPE